MASLYKSQLLFFWLLAVGVADGQSIVKRLPAPIDMPGIIADSVQAPITVMNAWRLELNVASYSWPGNAALNGLGASYEHLKWDGKKWVCKWSGNGFLWSRTSLSGEKVRGAIGVAVGLFNNLLLIGVANDLKTTFGTIGIGVNLNN